MIRKSMKSCSVSDVLIKHSSELLVLTKLLCIFQSITLLHNVFDILAVL